MAHVEEELLHVPGAGRAALGAQAAMKADILVLYHYPSGCERVRDVESLVAVERGCAEPLPEMLLGAVDREGDAVGRADVGAGIAFDAEVLGEDRLHVAV